MTSREEIAAESTRGKPQHLGWALALISVAQLMVVLDATIANIALPFIQEDLDISQANLTWIVTGYALAFGGLLLLGGRLGDLYGRRRVLMIGLIIFAVASLLGGMATNEGLLLGARGLQGLGAALASPAALSLITTTFPAGPQRSRAFGVYAAMSGAGAAVGLILGGWLTGWTHVLGADIEGWRLTFLINVPIGLAAAWAAPRLLPESESHPGELDIPGALTGTLGLFGIVFGLSRAAEEAYGWDHWQALVPLIGGILLLGLFVFIETRVEHPLMPLRIFTNRTRAVSFLAFMIAPAAMFAMFFYLSLFIQQVVGFSSLRTGFAFLPFSVGVVFGAILTQNLLKRFNPRYIAGVGTLMAAGALFGFSTLSVDTSPDAILGALAAGETFGADVNYWTELFPLVVLMSVGMGLTFVTLTLTAVHHVEARDSGVGSGVLNTMQQVGGALGLAVLATVVTQTVSSKADEIASSLTGKINDPAQLQQVAGGAAFTDGASIGFLVAAFMMLAAAAVIWIFLDVKHEELATEAPEGAGMH
ncbi:MFS transporter [soil metagenome]